MTTTTPSAKINRWITQAEKYGLTVKVEHTVEGVHAPQECVWVTITDPNGVANDWMHIGGVRRAGSSSAFHTSGVRYYGFHTSTKLRPSDIGYYLNMFGRDALRRRG